METRVFDVVVIGSGPAGLSAATAVAKAGLTTVTIDKMGPGGLLMNMGVVQDHPGLAGGTTGPDLLGQLVDEAATAGAEMAVDEVTRIIGGPPWTLAGSEAVYSAKTLIIATGLTAGTTGLPEEQDYVGRGLSHCATCDGPLYAGQPVVVHGSDDWAVQEAIELAHTTQHVTLVSPSPITATPARLAELCKLPNAVAIEGGISNLIGAQGLVCIVAGGREIPARALFAYAGREPATAPLGGRPLNAPGLFAAGDVRPGAAQRIAEAIADGQRAGQYAIHWVHGRSSGGASAKV